MGIAIGLQEATTVVIGNSVGDGNTDLAKRYFNVTRIISVCVFLVISTTIYLLKHQLPVLFTRDVEVIAMSTSIMYAVSIKHIFDGTQAYLQGVIRGLALQKIGAYLAMIAAYPI